MQPNAQSDQGGFYTPQQTPFTGSNLQQPARQATDTDQVVEWDASEYIHHEKGVGWSIAVGIVGLVAIGMTVWLKQWVLAVLLAVMTVVFTVYGFKRPRTVHYRLTSDSVTIGGKMYALTDYRAFGVVSEGPLFSIVLLPVKRFASAVTMYIAEADGEKIVNILGGQLPIQEMHIDFIDRFMRRLRF